MPYLKHLVFSAVLTLFAFSTVFYAACHKKKTVIDPCASVVCNNSGTCSGGSCTCTMAYDGTFCDSLRRNKFLGSWKGDLSCVSAPTDNDLISITAGSTDGQVIIQHLAGFQTNLTGNVINATRISVPSQNVAADSSFAGTITWLSDTSIKFEYTLEGANHDGCHGIYYKL